MAGTTRLELATSCVTGMRSNQLSYAPMLLYLIVILDCSSVGSILNFGSLSLTRATLPCFYYLIVSLVALRTKRVSQLYPIKIFLQEVNVSELKNIYNHQNRPDWKLRSSLFFYFRPLGKFHCLDFNSFDFTQFFFKFVRLFVVYHFKQD